MSQRDFSSLDREVMEVSFDLHNEFGRFCDEKLFQSELCHRCREYGFDAVETEVPIVVSYETFRKVFYADLLVNCGGLYELKATEGISPRHQTQTLTYLMLMELNHGKIINFRRSSVQHEFVSTQLTSERRRLHRTDRTRWDPCASCCDALCDVTIALVKDWGAFLQASLYMEAIASLMDNVSTHPESVELFHGRRCIGTQPMHLIDPSVGLVISGATKTRHYETHLMRLLRHTQLSQIQWINFAHHDITFVTLNNPNT